MLPALVLAACGGGSPPDPPPAQPPDLALSPGGHWFALQDGAQALFYISETGTVRAIVETAPATVPLIGGGTVTVTPSGAVNGSLRAGTQSPMDGEVGCALSGTLEERMALDLQVTCSDDAGIVYDEGLSLSPQTGYAVDTSLAEIAGNYTKPIVPAPNTNSLNIAGDGTIFGIWDSGQQCTVNGQVSVIDPEYNLLHVEWRFSGCTGFLPYYDGAELAGFALRETSSSWPAGTYRFVLTGSSDDGFAAVVTTYIPT